LPSGKFDFPRDGNFRLGYQNELPMMLYEPGDTLHKSRDDERQAHDRLSQQCFGAGGAFGISPELPAKEEEEPQRKGRARFCWISRLSRSSGRVLFLVPSVLRSWDVLRVRLQARSNTFARGLGPVESNREVAPRGTRPCLELLARWPSVAHSRGHASPAAVLNLYHTTRGLGFS